MAANPAGEYTEAVLQAVKDWIDAQQVRGLAEVYPGDLPDVPWDEHLDSAGDYVCIVIIGIPSDDEIRGAQVGPTSRGGKDRHYSIELDVILRAQDAEEGWHDSRVEYHRIMDALLDCLRGPGRDLNRPDLIFQVGEWPQSAGIRREHDEPFVNTEDGALIRRGTISFQVSQYLPTNVP